MAAQVGDLAGDLAHVGAGGEASRIGRAATPPHRRPSAASRRARRRCRVEKHGRQAQGEEGRFHERAEAVATARGGRPGRCRRGRRSRPERVGAVGVGRLVTEHRQRLAVADGLRQRALRRRSAGAAGRAPARPRCSTARGASGGRRRPGGCGRSGRCSSHGASRRAASTSARAVSAPRRSARAAPSASRADSTARSRSWRTGERRKAERNVRPWNGKGAVRGLGGPTWRCGNVWAERR